MSWQIGHPIQRDGTSQSQRLLDALRPERNPIDARRTEDLLLFLYRMAGQFAYYNENNRADGHWQAFFEELKDGDTEVTLESIRRYLAKALEKQDNSSFMSILLAFLQLFGYVQQDINGLTQKHLDYYYEQVLGFRRLPPRPDEVHVVLELAPHVQQHLLPAGTTLEAGKDTLGNPLSYVTNREIVLNKAKLGAIKTILVDADGAIYAAETANSADGQGAPLEGEPARWPTFGHPANMQLSTVGFAIASPLLLLREGERTITLKVAFDQLPEEIKEGGFDSFLAFGSGEDDWVPLQTKIPRISQNEVTFHLIASSNVPPIVAYNREKLAGQADTSFPVVRLVLNPNKPKYHILKSLVITKIDLEVTVAARKNQAGVRQLVVQSDLGVLDTGSAFQPFGIMPSKGAYFYIGSHEAFSKPLDRLTIQIQWANLPDEASNLAILNDSESLEFPVTFQLLINGQWTDEFGKVDNLFDINTRQVSPDKTLELSGGYLSSLRPNPASPEFETYETNQKQGFIRLVLKKDFGHRNYYKALAEYARISETPPPPPTMPYVPTVQSLSLGYSASQTITPGNLGTDIQFFHLLPFGSEEAKAPTILRCLPQLPRASLYLGFTDFASPANLQLLFQLAEGSAISTNILQPGDIEWTYLTNQGWRNQPLEGSEISADTTSGLQKSGIIAFSIGRDAGKESSLMPAGFHWLRASIQKDPAGASQAIAVHTQAVKAIFKDQNNAPGHLQQPLPAGRITALAESESAIRKVEQPYPSFGGLPAESNSNFYTRVSERLRHKQRAITLWDIERLVLQRFPSLYEAKVIPHTGFTGPRKLYSEFLPGQITVVAIPQLRHQNAANLLQPSVSAVMLEEIRAYLRPLATLFVGRAENAIHLINPFYEPIQLSFSVAFREGYSAGYYVEALNETLRRHLSPWAYETGVDIRFGGKIYKSQLLAFVEEQPYVDYVTDFKMIHRKREPGIGEMSIEIDLLVWPVEFDGDTDVAVASTAASILVSAEHHLIKILKPDEYSCDEPSVCEDGIGCWYIEIDFTVSNQ